ncbi:nucleoside diphosphate kinase regulator [Pelosinus fermentans]|uniref:nucleoside diphosphate kinase regulator n=1 Tax=Pelosinus fermentans TaxID=365349 RepID=UPI00030A86D2|nr:nucleoside diphosphate kinase regulator [Pelosinus fermentans]
MTKTGGGVSISSESSLFYAKLSINSANFIIKELVTISKEIFITNLDKKKLQRLIVLEEEFQPGNKDYLDDLTYELERAVVTQPEEIPADVITMHSQVVLKDLDNDEELIYTLVYPDEANIAEDKISVLAPIGTAILGYRVGDTLDWKIPNGTLRLKVDKILFQPESSGNFEL